MSLEQRPSPSVPQRSINSHLLLLAAILIDTLSSPFRFSTHLLRQLPYTYTPGCKGGEDDTTENDYCVNPFDIDNEPPVMSARQAVTDAVYVESCGEEAGSCGMCMGDCDDNTHVSKGELTHTWYEDIHFVS